MRIATSLVFDRQLLLTPIKVWTAANFDESMGVDRTLVQTLSSQLFNCPYLSED